MFDMFPNQTSESNMVYSEAVLKNICVFEEGTNYRRCKYDNECFWS